MLIWHIHAMRLGRTLLGGGGGDQGGLWTFHHQPHIRRSPVLTRAHMVVLFSSSNARHSRAISLQGHTDAGGLSRLQVSFELVTIHLRTSVMISFAP